MPLALTRLVFNAAAFGHRQRLQAVMVSQALGIPQADTDCKNISVHKPEVRKYTPES
jgi:hypothetical protein